MDCIGTFLTYEKNHEKKQHILNLKVQSDPENCYDVLQVARSASLREIKKAYRSLALKHHPDKTADKSDKRFVQIGLAYETLSDPESRAEYDYYL